MKKNKKGLKVIFFIMLLSCLMLNSISVSAASTVLKKGSQGKSVVNLQKDLKALGYFNSLCTGYYGNITSSAVKKLQKKYGLKQDGIAGKSTFSRIEMLLGGTDEKVNAAAEVKTSTTKSTVNKTDVSAISRGSLDRYGYLVPWFGGVEGIWQRGQEAEVLDVETGESFKVMRTYGSNHADCEALTPEDTAIMKRLYGGEWNWSRRAVIVMVGEQKIAASMAGMPHAGLDNQKSNQYVNGRSSGYGYGINLDTIKGNNMDGHFDIHFLGSKTHASNVVDKAHQNAVKKAAEWAKDNF